MIPILDPEPPYTCFYCGRPFLTEPEAISGCRAPGEMECESCWLQNEADADEIEAFSA